MGYVLVCFDQAGPPHGLVGVDDAGALMRKRAQVGMQAHWRVCAQACICVCIVSMVLFGQLDTFGFRGFYGTY